MGPGPRPQIAHVAMSATFCLRTWGPPLDQILDPHLASSGGLHPGGWADPPPESEKWAVCILLECFLVGFIFVFNKLKARLD